jgi:hypothetical protein
VEVEINISQILSEARHEDEGVKVVVKGTRDIVINFTEGRMVYYYDIYIDQIAGQY